MPQDPTLRPDCVVFQSLLLLRLRRQVNHGQLVNFVNGFEQANFISTIP